jgi:hypothetical protein
MYGEFVADPEVSSEDESDMFVLGPWLTFVPPVILPFIAPFTFPILPEKLLAEWVCIPLFASESLLEVAANVKDGIG